MSSLNIDSFFLYSVFKEQFRLLTCSHLNPLLFGRSLSHWMSFLFNPAATYSPISSPT